MTKTFAFVTVFLLMGCTNSLDAFESASRDSAEVFCDCNFMDAGYASAAECVSDSFNTLSDCERDVYDRYTRDLQPSIDCLIDVTNEFVSCARAAGCDDAALMACNDTRSTASNACPEPSAEVQSAIGIELEACISGPPGMCPDETRSGDVGMISSGSTAGRGNDLSGDCGGDSSPDVAVAWTAPTAGTFVFDTVGSDFDTVLYALDSCDAATSLACNDDAMGLQSEITLSLTAGQTVIIVIDGFGNDGGNYVVNARAM